MGQPITWQNVNTPNPGAAAPVLGQAQQSINGAFDAFSKIIAQRQANDASNVAVVNENQKNAYLDQLSTAKTPEELAALQKSGALDASLAGLTPQARAAVRGAQDARQTSVRADQTAATAFTDQVRNHMEAPKIGAIKDLANNGKFEEARALAKASGLYDPSEVDNYIKTSEQNAGDRTHMLAQRVLSDAHAARQDVAETQAAADQQTDRSISNDVGGFAAAYQKGMQEDRAGVNAALQDWKGKPIPRRQDGSVMFEGIGIQDRANINAFLKSKNVNSLEDVNTGDTQALEQATNELKKRGYTAQQIARAVPQLNSLFDTSSKAPVGSDAANLGIQQRANDAAAKEAEDNYGVVSTPGTVKGLTEAATAAINATTEPGSNRRANYVREVNKMINSGGVLVDDPNNKNGPKIRVLPSASTLSSLIGGTDQRFWTGGNTFTTTGEITDQLDAWIKRTTESGGAQKAIEYANTRRLRDVYQKDAPN